MDNFYYSLASGSSGNCGLLALDGTYILIDLGVSVRRLTGLLAGLGLTIDDLDAVLLTHEHIDHIKGMATFVKRYSVPLYTAIGTAEALLSKFPQAKIFSVRHTPKPIPEPRTQNAGTRQHSL